MSLLDISQQLTIYVGLFFLIIGVVGNSLDILIFSSVRTYRTTPCIFYFLAISIDNIGFLLINLIPRIISVGFGLDLTRTSVYWCRARQYLIAVLGLFSFICSSLASIDQFLATSRNANIRRLSNIKYTYAIVFLVLIISCFHGIPFLIFYDISPVTKTCVVMNNDYARYIPIYLLTFTCIGPVIIMIIFGYLTYRNIQVIRILTEQLFDRQLIKMASFYVLLVIITFFPYSVNTVYILTTAAVMKDANRMINENFATTVLTLITYFYYSVSSLIC